MWAPLLGYEETGNSETLAFNLWWDANTGSANIDLFEGLTSSTIVTGLGAGLPY